MTVPPVGFVRIRERGYHPFGGPTAR